MGFFTRRRLPPMTEERRQQRRINRISISICCGAGFVLAMVRLVFWRLRLPATGGVLTMLVLPPAIALIMTLCFTKSAMPFKNRIRFWAVQYQFIFVFTLFWLMIAAGWIFLYYS